MSLVNNMISFTLVVFLASAFGSLQGANPKVGNVQPESDIKINVIQGKVDGYPLFVSVNSSLKDFKSQSELPWLVEASTNFADPTENGLPKEAEFKSLNDWEDSVEASLAKVCRYVYAGHVTQKGERIALFYVDSHDAAISALDKFKAAPGSRLFSFVVRRDEKWERIAAYLKK